MGSLNRHERESWTQLVEVRGRFSDAFHLAHKKLTSLSRKERLLTPNARTTH
jgi:hypothetical protein